MQMLADTHRVNDAYPMPCKWHEQGGTLDRQIYHNLDGSHYITANRFTAAEIHAHSAKYLKDQSQSKCKR